MKLLCALIAFSFSTTLFGDIRLSKQNGKLSKLNWKVVNDTVMGGRSTSRWTSNSSEFVFQGNLSLENNGGFASIRCELKNNDLSNEDGIYLKVKGDGRKYQFRIQSKASKWANYSNEFKTKKDLVQTFYLPFKDFKPSWRGRRLSNLPTLKGEDVVGIGFLLGDKIQGKFKLEIIEVGATTKKSFIKLSDTKKTPFTPMPY